ncbi:hypothetical protein BT69DRAFT_709535 [Atractiella rhizophila]|nr:hypothetical protein BT69DRAFT_709535 [Atractiella rhizophila]
MFPQDTWGFLLFLDGCSLLVTLATLGSAIACIVLSNKEFWDHGMGSETSDDRSLEDGVWVGRGASGSSWGEEKMEKVVID